MLSYSFRLYVSSLSASRFFSLQIYWFALISSSPYSSTSVYLVLVERFRLNSKSSVPALSDNLFGRIGILNDEVTGITRELDGDCRTVASLADWYHIVEVNEMIGDQLITVCTGCFCFIHNIEEIAIVSIFQYTSQIA